MGFPHQHYQTEHQLQGSNNSVGNALSGPIKRERGGGLRCNQYNLRYYTDKQKQSDQAPQSTGRDGIIPPTGCYQDGVEWGAQEKWQFLATGRLVQHWDKAS